MPHSLAAQTSPRDTALPCRPGANEMVQRWQDVGGIEGVSLEWMLDRARAAQEATT
ncbi:hypothetical protein [Pelagivirga sediminicola]|uniref:hypothetical protein n=1 Tax=Pelagivirga sediminicola TaxID=2170575 RepID=UPI001402AABB|nr:hypothetical protein [Pelagivirga sediminicola]